MENIVHEEVRLNPTKIIKNLGLEGKEARQVRQSLVGLSRKEQIGQLKMLYPQAFSNVSGSIKRDDLSQAAD